ncbi:hypothetical protein [Vibrio sp. R78045]|uniref:hypothetical protein n=1 Tax=Vibrio sp. R78045 TaxID=3093868 RepID=UPI0036F30E10
MERFKLRDIAMVCLGALLMFLYFEFEEMSPLNQLREEYSEDVSFSEKQQHKGLPLSLALEAN